MADLPSLFGTDGIRGVANRPPLVPEMIARIGSAAVEVMGRGLATRPTVVIGRDTRVSGDLDRGALIAGMTSVGARLPCAREPFPPRRSRCSPATTRRT